ncbi:choice-of-anchor P family protein [Nocardioides sp. SYSU DS0663]|uniref:choice-of-anchor P family protein n=1 Tax=Nocardioides sp. SYSU DS0663 TaxID=3416445 RepID=UPI003F4BE2E3
MRPFFPVATAVATAAATAVLAVPPAHAAVPPTTSAAAAGPTSTSTAATRAARVVKTPFALKAAGYGTRVEGGQVPVGSDTTAFQSISCTNKAPLARGNDVAAVDLPGLGTVEGVRTRNRTFTNRTKGKTTVVSQHDVARVKLGPLVLRGVSSKARVWHDAEGFHREVRTNLLGLEVAGQSVPIPVDQQVIPIPGLATITLGHDSGKVGRNGASAFANGLKIVLEPSGTVVRVAHSAAHIHKGLKVGHFRGRAFGTQVNALADNVRSGPQPLSYMPCQGTFGDVRTKTLAGVDLADQLVVSAARNDVMGKTVGKGKRERATGYLQSRIARVTLGPLTINAIKGRVNVTRFRGGKLVRNTQGTTLGELVMDGEAQALPDPGQPIEIPGVGLVKIEFNVADRIKNGIQVTALRITLLDGDGAEVNLGNARLQIKPTGATRG